MFIQRLKEAFKQAKSNKGFSLIELLVVIGIIAILASIAIPSYNAYQANAKRGVDDSVLQTAMRTVQINQSLGTSTNAAELSTKIKSKGVAVKATVFTVNVGGTTSPDNCVAQPANTISDECTKWCVNINSHSTDKLDGGTKNPACIQADGTIFRAATGCASISVATVDPTNKKSECAKKGCNFSSGSNNCADAAGTCDTTGICK